MSDTASVFQGTLGVSKICPCLSTGTQVADH